MKKNPSKLTLKSLLMSLLKTPWKSFLMYPLEALKKLDCKKYTHRHTHIKVLAFLSPGVLSEPKNCI